MTCVLAAATGVDPALWERLGTAGVVAAVMGIAIVWLTRQLAAERARNDALAERLVATVERVLPVLDRAERALDRGQG